MNPNFPGETPPGRGGPGPVLFFDTGVGGLPYLGWLKEQAPEIPLVYFADAAHFPYGTKTAAEIREILIPLMGRLLGAFKPRLTVLACNTATLTALEALRQSYAAGFVGVVPAIKPAAAGGRRIGILATRRTVDDGYTVELIRNFARRRRVFRRGSGELVDFVEKRYLNSGAGERREAVRPAAEFLLDRRVDTVVLACTHFVFLKEEFQEALGPKVRVLDSVEGVGRRALSLLEEGGEQNSGEAVLPGGFYLSGAPAPAAGEVYRSFASRFGLEYRGGLE
ncbi:MAG: glutamate racemase [Spirochaetales bacterium]|jgi:glutamate racemase|nr:glutamate racemase [Spirochaetales bacterium]